jgi:hypothetical protein
MSTTFFSETTQRNWLNLALEDNTKTGSYDFNIRSTLNGIRIKIYYKHSNKQITVKDL